MTKPDAKGLELLETPEGLVVHTPSRQAYLLTLYMPVDGKSVVLLQASHNPACLQFPDLKSAVAHIASVSHFQQDKEDT